MEIDDIFINNLCARAKFTKSGLWVYQDERMRDYAERSLSYVADHWSFAGNVHLAPDGCNLAVHMLADRQNFVDGAEDVMDGYWAMAYGLQRFVELLLPSGSHEERLTGFLIASLVLTPPTRSRFRCYWADASIGWSEKITGSDFLLAVRWDLPDGTPFLSLAFIQVKKGRNKRIKITDEQHKKLLDTGAGHYLCLDRRAPARCSIIPADSLNPVDFLAVDDLEEGEVTLVDDGETVDSEDEEGFRTSLHDHVDLDFGMFTIFGMTLTGNETSTIHIGGDPETFADQTAVHLDTIGWRPTGALVVDMGTGWDGISFLRACGYDSDMAFALPRKRTSSPRPLR